MTNSRRVLLGSIIGAIIASGASAGSDPLAPYAKCRTIVEEREYKNGGERLVETRVADLVRFPKGFLGVACEGGLSLQGIVQENGTVMLSGLNHAVTCDGELESGDLERLNKSIWRGAVVGQRFETLRYESPRMADVPVCVRIRRGWSPDAPHRFSSPEDRRDAH